MRYFSFLQYVMRFCSGTSRATDDGGIVKVSLVSKQSLSPLSLATFDSASRQRRSRRRLAAFTSTQGSRKMSRPLTSLQNCEKNRVGIDVLGAFTKSNNPSVKWLTHLTAPFTQGSQKISRSLTSLQNCEKNRVGTDVLDTSAKSNNPSVPCRLRHLTARVDNVDLVGGLPPSLLHKGAER